MRWLTPKPAAEPQHVQGVTQEELDEFWSNIQDAVGDIKRVEDLIPELQKMITKLTQVTSEAKQAKNELEATIATSRRVQRRGY